MHQITSVVSTGSPPLTFDWEDLMNSSSFVHYVRDQVIFISMTTIATILLFTLGLMAAASLDGKAQTAGIVGAVVIGLWLRGLRFPVFQRLYCFMCFLIFFGVRAFLDCCTINSNGQ